MEKKTFIKLQIAFFVIAGFLIAVTVDSLEVVTLAEMLKRFVGAGICIVMALMNFRLYEAIEEEKE